MDIGLMIEGQDGLNWDRWRRILRAAEDLGFAHVFRSDHFTNPNPPDKDSLELWTSLTFAASETKRIQFGPLVSPVTFRHPSMVARVAAAVDDLSDGRLTLGLGAGWQEREHHNFGIPFPPTGVRYEMLVDYLEVVSRLFWSDDHVSYEGTHFSLDDAILLPRPKRKYGPPILVGGNGEKRTLPLAAKYATEWNGVFLTPQRFREKSEILDGLLDKGGRPRDTVRRSLMLGTVFAPDESTLREKLEARGLADVDEARQHGVVAGTPEMWVEQLGAYREAGVQRVMLQWLEVDNIEGIEIVARDVMPAVGGAPSGKAP